MFRRQYLTPPTEVPVTKVPMISSALDNIYPRKREIRRPRGMRPCNYGRNVGPRCSVLASAKPFNAALGLHLRTTNSA